MRRSAKLKRLSRAARLRWRRKHRTCSAQVDVGTRSQGGGCGILLLRSQHYCRCTRRRIPIATRRPQSHPASSLAQRKEGEQSVKSVRARGTRVKVAVDVLPNRRHQEDERAVSREPGHRQARVAALQQVNRFVARQGAKGRWIRRNKRRKSSRYGGCSAPKRGTHRG
eukprot:3103452-Pleurochrysis_carterae.AAC.1